MDNSKPLEKNDARPPARVSIGQDDRVDFGVGQDVLLQFASSGLQQIERTARENGRLAEENRRLREQLASSGNAVEKERGSEANRRLQALVRDLGAGDDALTEGQKRLLALNSSEVVAFLNA